MPALKKQTLRAHCTFYWNGHSKCTLPSSEATPNCCVMETDYLHARINCVSDPALIHLLLYIYIYIYIYVLIYMYNKLKMKIIELFREYNGSKLMVMCTKFCKDCVLHEECISPVKLGEKYGTQDI